jgi:F0F1-type ATP synthase delta subunit
MTKRQIKLLAKASYLNNELDGTRSTKIANRLTREELKNYLRALKSIEKQRTVTVIVPDISVNNKRDIEKRFTNLFKDKKIVMETDSELLVGLKIINNDLVYELSLQNTFDKINDYLLEQYD